MVGCRPPRRLAFIFHKVMNIKQVMVKSLEVFCPRDQ